jgi:hypothetical protein
MDLNKILPAVGVFTEPPSPLHCVFYQIITKFVTQVGDR